MLVPDSVCRGLIALATAGLLLQWAGVQKLLYTPIMYAASTNQSTDQTDTVEEPPIYHCSLIPSPTSNTAKENTFVPFGRGTSAYSAYYDRRVGLVRVFGVLKVNQSQLSGIRCLLWYEDQGQPEVTWAQIKSWDKRYQNRIKFASAGYMCPSERRYHKFNGTSSQQPPTFVTLTLDPCDPNGTHASLAVNDAVLEQPEFNFTVCVHGPFYSKNKGYRPLVEFVEISRIFGAEKVVVYNMSGAATVAPYIHYYVNEGMMDLYQWRPPIHYSLNRNREMKTGGQVAMLNDCIYRYMYRTRYLVLVNVDEFIVLRYHGTWASMMNASSCGDKAEANFRIILFPRSSHRKLNSTSDVYKRLMSVTQDMRQSNTMLCKDRSKSIIQPSLVYEGAVHGMKSYIGSYCCVEETVGVIHHYKAGWLGLDSTVYIQDTFMDRYADRLAQAVQGVISAVNNTKFNHQ